MESEPSSTIKISIIAPKNDTSSSSEQHEVPISTISESLPQPVPMSETGIDEKYSTNPAECSEVITEQPSQFHDLFPPEVSISEEDTAESVAIVEQALSRTHFKEANGFTLKYSGTI